MTRQTGYHGWTTPTAGDANYVTVFDRLINNIDKEALRIVDSLPSGNTEARWLIRTSDRQLFYDNGSSFVEITPERVLPDRIGARDDKDEVIGAEWSFDNVISTDITGQAYWADNVTNADMAKNGNTNFGGVALGNYARKDNNQTVDGSWTFNQKVDLSGMDIQSGTLKIPNHG